MSRYDLLPECFGLLVGVYLSRYRNIACLYINDFSVDILLSNAVVTLAVWLLITSTVYLLITFGAGVSGSLVG